MSYPKTAGNATAPLHGGVGLIPMPVKAPPRHAELDSASVKLKYHLPQIPNQVRDDGRPVTGHQGHEQARQGLEHRRRRSPLAGNGAKAEVRKAHTRGTCSSLIKLPVKRQKCRPNEEKGYFQAKENP